MPKMSRRVYWLCVCACVVEEQACLIKIFKFRSADLSLTFPPLAIRSFFFFFFFLSGFCFFFWSGLRWLIQHVVCTDVQWVTSVASHYTGHVDTWTHTAVCHGVQQTHPSYS